MSGDSEENYRIREVAEMVRQVVPESVIKYAPGGGPDARCYRVDCGKIARTLPEFRPQWTAPKGIAELYAAYRRHGLTAALFLGTKYLPHQAYSGAAKHGPTSRLAALAETGNAEKRGMGFLMRRTHLQRRAGINRKRVSP